MGLRSYLIRRILLVIPTLIGVTLLIFAVIQFFSPIDRASLFITDIKGTSDLDAIIAKYHLNDPVYLQYLYWLQAVLSGNLGWSYSSNMPVLKAMLKAFPTTAELVLISIPVIVLGGIKLGVASAVHRDKLIDHATRFLAIIGWSLPTFWLGLILLAVFFGGLHWFAPGRLGTTSEDFVNNPTLFTQFTGIMMIDGPLNGRPDIALEALQHLVLPTITLTIISIAMIIRVMRSSMLEALSKGYITMARAKGLTEKEVINKHAQRNALIPTITLSGLLAAGMLNGVVITETVFQYKGLGYWAAKAALAAGGTGGSDVPAVLGFALFTGILFVIANLIVDITYAYIDPRIRLE